MLTQYLSAFIGRVICFYSYQCTCFKQEVVPYFPIYPIRVDFSECPHCEICCLTSVTLKNHYRISDSASSRLIPNYWDVRDRFMALRSSAASHSTHVRVTTQQLLAGRTKLICLYFVVVKLSNVFCGEYQNPFE